MLHILRILSSAAKRIAADDDLIDAIYEQFYFEMMDYTVEYPEIQRANYALWAGHNLERTAVRGTSIFDRTIVSKLGNWRYNLTRQGLY